MNQLEQEFQARVNAAVLECHRLKYYPNDFEGMLSEASAARVAEKLVSSGKLHDGLRKLAGMGRLDLTVESIMLEEQFESLFTTSLLDAARWRLDQVR